MPTRRLALQRETLTNLDSDELASVAGAISYPHPVCVLLSYGPSCAVRCTLYCPPTYQPCPPPSDTY